MGATWIIVLVAIVAVVAIVVVFVLPCIRVGVHPTSVVPGAKGAARKVAGGVLDRTLGLFVFRLWLGCARHLFLFDGHSGLFLSEADGTRCSVWLSTSEPTC